MNRYNVTYDLPQLAQNGPRELAFIVDTCVMFGCSALLFDAVGACGTVSAEGEVRIW
jgi:hypothetical protein